MSNPRQIHVYREEVTLSLLSGLAPDQSRMILCPFVEGQLSLKVVESALQMAEATAAELILLCVRFPKTAARIALEDEQLFSDLKSLQAQFQTRDVPVKIETIVGPVAQFVSDYGRQHQVDLILIPGFPAGSRRTIQA